jgi:hypothetical protein
MTRNEAVTLLAACKPLADRLSAQDMNICLKTQRDRDAMKGFNQLWSADLLDDVDIYQQAGLSKKDITNLKYFLFQCEARDMQCQYEMDNTRTNKIQGYTTISGSDCQS